MSEFNRKLGDAVTASLNTLLVLAVAVFVVANLYRPAYDAALSLIVGAGAISLVVGFSLAFSTR